MAACRRRSDGDSLLLARAVPSRASHTLPVPSLWMEMVPTPVTGGMGNWFVSLVEDIVAFFVSLLSLILPVLAGVLALVLIVYLIRAYWRRQRRKRIRGTAVLGERK